MHPDVCNSLRVQRRSTIFRTGSTSIFRTGSTSSGGRIMIQTKGMLGTTRSRRSWRAKRATRSSSAEDFAVTQPKNDVPPRSVMTSLGRSRQRSRRHRASVYLCYRHRSRRQRALRREASPVEQQLLFLKAFGLRQRPCPRQAPRCQDSLVGLEAPVRTRRSRWGSALLWHRDRGAALRLRQRRQPCQE